MHLPYDLAIPLLGICPRAVNTSVHMKTSRQIFIVTLSTRNWKQPKCLSAEEWLSQLGHPQSRILLSD